MKCTPAQVGKTPADLTKVFFLTEIAKVVSSVFVKSAAADGRRAQHFEDPHSALGCA